MSYRARVSSVPNTKSAPLYSEFGNPGSQYDFTSIEVDTLRKRCDELESSTEGMKKKVNPKVMNMIDRCACITHIRPAAGLT